MLESLILKFIESKKEKPSNVNELLDFLQKEYISSAISITQYRNLFRELDARGAVKPSYSDEYTHEENEALAL